MGLSEIGETGSVSSTVNEPNTIDAEWWAEFDAAVRRPLELRLKHGFVRTYKPALDDARFRAFDTMEEYRQWCNSELPIWRRGGQARVGSHPDCIWS